jgi:hypothetical protein
MTSSGMGGALRRGAGAVVLTLAATALVAPAAGAATERKLGKQTVSFPSTLERGDVTLRQGTHRVAFALEGAKGRVEMRKRGAIVRNALPGVSLTYSMTPGALKEGLVLASAKAPRAFRFTLATGDLKPVLLPDRSIALRDSHGTTRMVVPAPFMFDTDAGDVDVSHDVAVSLKRVRGGAWRLTLRPDRAWLTAADRAWPVVVDPTVAAEPIFDPIAHLNTTIKGQFYALGMCGRDSPDPYCKTYAPVDRVLTNRGLEPNCDIYGNPPPCKRIKPDLFTFIAADIGKPHDPETNCTVTHEQANPAGRIQYRATNLCEMATPIPGRISTVTIESRVIRPTLTNDELHRSGPVECRHTPRCGLDPLSVGYTENPPLLFAQEVGFHTQETIVRLTLNEPTDIDPWIDIDKRADTPPGTRLEEECLPGTFVGADGVVRNRVTIRCRIRTLFEVTSGPGDGNGLPRVGVGMPQAPSTPRVPRVPAVPALPPVPSSPVPIPSTAGLCLKDPFAWGCPLGPIGP